MSNSKEQLFSDEYVKGFLGLDLFGNFDREGSIVKRRQWDEYVKRYPPKKEEIDYSGVRWVHFEDKKVFGTIVKKIGSNYLIDFYNEQGAIRYVEYINNFFMEGFWIEVKEETPIKQVTVNTDFGEFVYNNPHALKDVEQTPLVHSELPKKEIHEILYLKNRVDELERRLSYVELRGFATIQRI